MAQPEGVALKKPVVASLPVWIVSCGGLGRIPVASGTFGAAGGTLAAWLLSSGSAQWVAALASLVAGLIFIPKVQEEFGKDPSVVVIDEFCGALVTFAGFEYLTVMQWAVGFLAFRLLDILKPFPIARLERLPGAWGVLLDDVAAGVVARGVVYIVVSAQWFSGV